MNSVRDKLRRPAIALILVGAINAFLGVLFILSALVAFVKGPAGRLLENEDEKLGYIFGSVFWPTLGLISILASPLVIYGAIQMFRVRRYSMARLAAILALIPVTSVCCISGIPVGIWALIVLSQPEVRAAFANLQEGPVLSP
jgi:hypothetical protein